MLSFRRLLERLTEQTLFEIDRDPAQDVRNCSITPSRFDPAAGGAGKLRLNQFNQVEHLAGLGSDEPSRTRDTS